MTGETAIILRNNSEFLTQPVIKFLTDRDGNKVEKSPEIDLSQIDDPNGYEIESII